MNTHTHGALTEYSLRAPIGKGREGNRKGREEEIRFASFHHIVTYVPAPRRDEVVEQ